MRFWLAFCGGLIFLAFTCWLGTALLTGGAIMNTQFQWLLTNPYLVEMIKQLFRHALRQINGAVVIMQCDMTNKLRVNVRFIGDRANNIFW